MAWEIAARFMNSLQERNIRKSGDWLAERVTRRITDRWQYDLGWKTDRTGSRDDLRSRQSVKNTYKLKLNYNLTVILKRGLSPEKEKYSLRQFWNKDAEEWSNSRLEKLRNEVFYNLYSSPRLILAVKREGNIPLGGSKFGWRITLKSMHKKYGVWMWTGSIWLRIGCSGGLLWR
jgi:hypothetical protein